MDNKPVSTACILDGDAVRVWHEASDERLKRALAQQGISRFLKQEDLTDSLECIQPLIQTFSLGSLY